MQDNIFLLPSRQAPAEPGWGAPTSNLPAPLTALIGREHEVAALCALLRRPQVRLVTFTGTGGVGKTRLALAGASKLLDDFADGIYFVSLAPLSDPDLVLPTIAQTFHLKETADWLPLEHLKSYLHEKRLLLLLDNFEQVVTAAPLLVELLQACPALKMLVTSRLRLRVSGEQEFPVPPLALPDPQHLPENATLMEYAAVALFVQRAQALKPTFQLTAGNARALAEICLHLDGLPLAIELAAARIKLLSPQALLARLSHRLQVLTAGVQDAPVRQQTLRNTIAWSYDLLTAQEQRLFRRLSVFVGGCTLEAAEQVCTATSTLQGDVLDGLASLVDKSLLRQEEQGEGEPRFAMLQTLREFGLERLADLGETEAIRSAHALYYLTLAEEAEPHLRGAEQTRWLARLEQEHENLRGALSWLLERAKMGAQEGTEQAERALRLGAALLRFWYIRGHFREGQTFLERALSVREGAIAPMRAKVLYMAAELAHAMDDYERAEVLGEESLALFRELGDASGMAASLFLLGSVAWTRTQYATSRSQYEEAAKLFQQVSDSWRNGRCLTQLARISTAQGEYSRARALLEESLGVYQALGDQERLGWVLYLLAQVLFVSQEDPARAYTLAEQGLALSKGVGVNWVTAYELSLLGQMRLVQGEQALARELAEESVTTLKGVGDRWGSVDALLGLARVVAYQGDLAAAHARYQESLEILRELDSKALIAACLEGLGAVVVVQKKPEWAARLWGTAEALREAIGAPMPPVYRAEYERALAAARTALGEEAFATAWAQGRAMSPDQALAAQGSMPISAPATTGQSSTQPAKTTPTYPAGLTAREVEVLRLVAQGLTNAQIAEQLTISLHTVNAHVRSIFNKLDVNSRNAVTRFALEHHLL